VVAGGFYRAEERMDLASPVLITEGGFLFTRDRVAPLAEDTRSYWLFYLRKSGCIEAPEQDQDELLAPLLCLPTLPPLEVPEDARYESISQLPKLLEALREAFARMREELPLFQGVAKLCAAQPSPGIKRTLGNVSARLLPFGEIASCTLQLPSEIFQPALRRCYPRVDGPRRIVTDVLLMPAFKFGYPLVVFIKVKVNDLSGSPDRFCLHRLHRARRVTLSANSLGMPEPHRPSCLVE
jgi:hypothetical protein